MLSPKVTAVGIAIALAGTLAMGSASSGQEAPQPADREATTVMAPAFEWQRTSTLPGLSKLAKSGCPYRMRDAAFTPSGTAIVVGGEIFDCGFGGASTWRSEDGREWDRELLKGGDRAMDAAATEAGIVVVGTKPSKKGSNAVVWTAADGAPSRRATTMKDASLSVILVTPEGYMAVGVTDYEQGYGFPAVWSSTDGLAWEESIGLGDKRGYPPVAAVGPSGVRLVADPGRNDGVLWRSEDGVGWEELQLPEEIRVDKEAQFWNLEGGDSGFVLTLQGLDKDKRALQIWRSVDGREWAPVAALSTFAGGLASGPMGYFAFTAPPSDKRGRLKKGEPGAMLWSADGSAWCRMELDALAGVEVHGSDVASDGRLLLTGASGESFTGSPFVLLGRPIEGTTVPCEPIAAPEGLPATITFGEPVIELPSTVAACADRERSGSPNPSMYCVSDLLAAGAQRIKPAKALKDAPEGFSRSACVKPAGGKASARAMLCLSEIASAWREQQHEADADGMVSRKAFDQVLPMYRWAAGNLSKADKAYLDRGLSKLDQMPLAWRRPTPEDLKKVRVVSSARTRNTSASALRKTLQAAWLQSDMAPIPDARLEMPGGWEKPDVPSGPFGPGYPVDQMAVYLGMRGGVAPATDLISKCELAVDPAEFPNVSGTIRTSTCGVAAANAWLLYLATGDERFIDVAVGLRDMAVRARTTEGYSRGVKGKERLFFETLACWTGDASDDRGCASGL